MRRKGHGKVGPDRWQISYADLLTLLLGLFVVLYATASREGKTQAENLADLAASFTQEASLWGWPFVLSPSSSGAVESPIATLAAPQPEDLPASGDTFNDWRQDGDWLLLSLSTEQLFASGSADLSPAAKSQLNSLSSLLEGTTGPIEVEGHTDNQPIATQRFADNWILSGARAVAVVNQLLASGRHEGARFKALGLGEFHPVADNATDVGREQNRRVVIRVVAPPPDSPLWLAVNPDAPNASAPPLPPASPATAIAPSVKPPAGSVQPLIDARPAQSGDAAKARVLAKGLQLENTAHGVKIQAPHTSGGTP